MDVQWTLMVSSVHILKRGWPNFAGSEERFELLAGCFDDAIHAPL